MVKRILILVLFFISETCISQVQVKLDQPSTNQFRVKDLWKITVKNNSSKDIELILRGTVDEINEGRIVEGKTGLFKLKGNESRRISVDNIPGGGVYNWSNRKFQEAMIRNGNAPDGVYTICIYAENVDGASLGLDCIQQTIALISPPILITPTNGEIISEQQYPFFTWLPPTPSQQGITYKIIIVDIFGSQSADEAIRVNPIRFTQNNISSTTFQIPISARLFEPKKKYGWQIIAFNKNDEVGRSEVWHFLYGSQDVGEKKILKSPCEKLKAEFKKSTLQDTVFYKLSITNNNLDMPTENLKSFRITVKGDIIGSVRNSIGEVWAQSQSKNKSNLNSITWTYKNGSIPSGTSILGNIVLDSKKANSIKIYFEWLDDSNTIVCNDSISLNESRIYYELSEEKPSTFIEISGNTLGVQFVNNYATLNNTQFFILDNYKPIFSEKNLEAPELKGQNIINFSINGFNKVTIDLQKYKLSSNKIYNLMVADSKHCYYLNFKIVN